MTDNNKTIKKITLAYFSGTGCTKTVADSFEHQLLAKGIVVNKLNIASCNRLEVGEADLVIIFSPVYAFRLTSIVEKWVKSLPETQNTYAAIISVSGGGEVSPNTACRVQCKRFLKKKGYNLIYEKMLVMPSNFAIQAEQDLNSSLIAIMPQRVKQIISDILSGKKNISHPKLQDRLFATIGKAEHLGAKFWGRSIHSSKDCNKCGLCIRNCPKKNIQMKNGKPKFGFRCMWCLKCIYSCPQKALSPRILKFTVLKNGFDLEKLSEMSYQNRNEKEYQSHRSALWQGVIDYLNNDSL